MINKKYIPYILVGIVVLIVLGMRQTIPKEAVADIEGQPCNENADCPCLGVYNVTEMGGTITEEEAVTWGIGVGRCKSGVCSMTTCFDLVPILDWAEDKPLGWITDPANTMIVIAIVALLLLVLFGPAIGIIHK